MSREKNKKARGRRKIISICFSFFISLCTTLIMLSILLKGGLFNQQLFNNTLSESAFYDNKLEEIKTNIDDILVSAGFPGEISENIVTRTLITVEIDKVIKGHEIDTTDFSEIVKEKIMTYISENNIPTDDNMLKAVDVMIADMVKVYETHMTMLFAKMYNEFCSKYIGIINIILYVSCALFLICAIILMMMYSRKYRGMRYVGYGLVSGSIMIEVISIIAKRSLAGMITDGDTEYYNVIISFIDKSFSQGMYMSLCGIMIFCMMLLIISYMKKHVI